MGGCLGSPRPPPAQQLDEEPPAPLPAAAARASRAPGRASRLGPPAASAAAAGAAAAEPAKARRSVLQGALPWVKDSEAATCAGCDKPFVGGLVTSGKHHCRRCGRVVCDPCSQSRRALPELGLLEPVRVCNECESYESQRLAFEHGPLPMLLSGANFVKHHMGFSAKGASSNRRFVRLSDDLQRILWHKPTDETRVESLRLSELTGVERGHATAVFRKSGRRGTERFCFSLMAASRTLDLEADSQTTRDAWADAILSALEFVKVKSPEEERAEEEAARAAAEAAEQEARRAEEEAARKREAGLRKNEQHRSKLAQIREQSAARAAGRV